MRVNQSMYYKNLYNHQNSQLQTKLFDVNKQIASGIKIQYAHEDVIAFSDTMRLDNEITNLEQIKKSTESGEKISDQTDIVLNDFEDTINRMRTLLLQAANDTNDEISLDAITAELRAKEQHLINLANTSINGKYLFAGSATDIKPISPDGTYNGNDKILNAFLGSNNKQAYNITGSELFLGEEISVRRQITTNVRQSLNAPTGGGGLSTASTMSEFMGDVGAPNTHYFFVRGTQSNGTAFNSKITMNDAETIQDLLNKIGNAFGNTVPNEVVNVTMNGSGHITVSDRLAGSSKLDFHIVGATDFAAGDSIAAINDIDTLDAAGTTVYGGANLYIKEFVKSGLTKSTAAGVSGTAEGTLYDRTQFTVNGNKVSGNISQIVKSTNAFADPTTKILDVASGTTLDTKQLAFNGTDRSGAAFSATINFLDAGSTFTVGANTYNLYNAASTRVATPGNEVTYQQLMDVMNMIVTGQLPAAAPGSAAQYDAAVKSSKALGTTSLSYDGKIIYGDINPSTTQVTMALHDAAAVNFAVGTSAPMMTFNSNNSLTVRDPKTDFFKDVNEIVNTVANYLKEPDATVGTKRHVGVQNAIAKLDDIQDHLYRVHSKSGAQTNALSTAIEKTIVLDTNTRALRSSIIDTDLAEASLQLTQLTLNYEAMLSTVGKVSRLTLVNYL